MLWDVLERLYESDEHGRWKVNLDLRQHIINILFF